VVENYIIIILMKRKPVGIPNAMPCHALP